MADGKKTTRKSTSKKEAQPSAKDLAAAAVIREATPQGQLDARRAESLEKNKPATLTIEVPKGRDKPETLSETLAARDKVSEEARSSDRPLVTSAAILPPDTSVPTNRVTTTSPPMGVPDDTKFVTPKEKSK